MSNRVNRNILHLAVPSILANITVPLVGMVDIAVAGHLDATTVFSVATLIGGVSIGSMLFDLLYWNFGFLRIGTGGLTAQAFGRGDMRETAAIFSRATGIAFLCALALIAIQWLFVEAAFLVIDCTPEVRELASLYFFIRIWACPATLMMMAFKGWFIGMQDSISPMIIDITVNVVNAVVSIIWALGLRIGDWGFDGIGFAGVAAGTVVAQYTGLMTAVLLLMVKYRKKVFEGFGLAGFFNAFKGHETRKFFMLNTDLFIRSICFIGIYIGFTTFAAHYGDLMLASATILMKIMMLFSYFTDGFAYAGEALTGRYIGERNRYLMVRTVRSVFLWSLGIGLMFTVLYGFAGEVFIRVMTSDEAVIDVSGQYVPWLVIMPMVGCAAFTWDGIYIGATASKTIRNAMLWAAAAFFAVYFTGIAVCGERIQEDEMPETAVHILLAAYFVHLIIRAFHLTLKYRKRVLDASFT